MKENNELKILDEFYKNVNMGMESYRTVSEKVMDGEFKEELNYQYNEYKRIENKLNNIYKEYDELPKEASIGNKVMAWTGIQMNTMKDKTSSHISDMIIQGATMGITDSVKLLNSNEIVDNRVKTLLNDYVEMQQENIERLQEFL